MPVILLVIIIVLCYKNNNKADEIAMLKKKIRKLEEKNSILKEYVRRYVEQNGENIVDNNILNEVNVRPVEVQKTPVQEQTPVRRSIQNNVQFVEDIQETNRVRQPEYVESKVKKEPISKEDSRNTLILAAGAVFIILAAIVFLISTWAVIPNIIKTVILVVFVEVFLGLSKVAKEKFNLPNASNTFFYIAMAYIPICLYSISLFGLFGEYLSIVGQGRHIYFTIINIVIAVIYMYQYNKNESKVLMYGSILMQYLSVIFFSLIFSTEFLRVLTCLGLYNIVVYMFMDKLNCRNVLSLIFNIMTIVLTVLTFGFFENSLLMVGNMIILAINYLCLEKIEPKKIYAILFNICLVFAGALFVDLFELTESVKQIIVLAYIIAIFVIQNSLIINKNKENLKFSSIVVTVGTILLLQLNAYTENIGIPGYVYSLVNVVLLLISHGMKDEFIKDVSSALIPVEFIASYFNLGIIHGANLHYFMVCSILTFVFGECIRNPKLDKLNKAFFYISHINLFLTMFLIIWEEEAFFKNFIYLIIMTEIYGYSYIKNPKQNTFFKYIDYIFTNISLLSICLCFNINDTIKCLIPLVSTLIFIAIEEKLPKLDENRFPKDDYSDFYLAINSAVAIGCMVIAENVLVHLLGLVFVVGMMYRYYKNNEIIFYNIVPIIGFYVLISALYEIESLQILLLSLSIVGFGWLSLKNKNINVFTIAGYLSIIFMLDLFDNELIITLAAFVYTLLHVFFMENDKYKDVYRVVTTIIFMNFYTELLFIMGLDDVIFFALLGLLGAFSYLSRNVINKYIQDVKVLEYIVIAILYLGFIGEATELSDAISIILVQVLFMIISYYKKYGAQFVGNTAMLIVSGIYLTKGFWALIPWWLYLLGIGSVLIGTAVRNEAKEKTEKINVGKIIDNVIDKIEN